MKRKKIVTLAACGALCLMVMGCAKTDSVPVSESSASANNSPVTDSSLMGRFVFGDRSKRNEDLFRDHSGKTETKNIIFCADTTDPAILSDYLASCKDKQGKTYIILYPNDYKNEKGIIEVSSPETNGYNPSFTELDYAAKSFAGKDFLVQAEVQKCDHSYMDSDGNVHNFDYALISIDHMIPCVSGSANIHKSL